ncbi:MAG: indolepyruvate ferredoxin oxidoreductase [Deltaproteobacteria bacterium ADurb.Bin510]|nr:MAG: indolepyruvate ferredoxin oxidoreductase [Deltaproteobacteria bacterium ADurb.Bin510]
MKKILSGNAAFARGAYEAGVTVASAYPGTPSTEILEDIAKTYPEIYAEWAPNEKVALEVASGASLTGARTMAVMKHVGVNVAADPLMSMAYTEIRGGLVLISCDDPQLFSSQNEQDNRQYARFAKIPMLEPASSQEAKDYMLAAFELSEAHGCPVLVRSTTRISHSLGVVELGEPLAPPKTSMAWKPENWVLLPAHARRRHPEIEARLEKLREIANSSPLNVIEPGDKKLGIIASGVAYQYAREACPEASFLKLGFSYPLPDEKVREFAAMVDELWVVEELDPFMEDQIKAMRSAIVGTAQPAVPSVELPPRPPSMCPGCPHRGMLYALKKAHCFICGDIGCYTLGFLPPLAAIDTCLCMGAGINQAHGMAKAFGERQEKIAAVLGDSTFFHSGVTGVMNLAYNQGAALVVILDNRITAMTGAQENPGTGQTLKGDPTSAIDIETLVRALNVPFVATVNPYEHQATLATVNQALETNGPAVIISKAPCVLLRPKSLPFKPFKINPGRCTGCKACLKLGCPAIEFRPKLASINDLCVGCGACVELCKFGAISGGDK